LDRKSEPRYIGPFVVHKKARKGSYVLQELDGTMLHSHVAGFHLIPYITRDDDILKKLSKDNPHITEAIVKELMDEFRSDKVVRIQDRLQRQMTRRIRTRPKKARQLLIDTPQKPEPPSHPPAHCVETDAILPIKSEFIKLIVSKDKNHEYRSYKLKDTVK
jgi:hypothetical protein